MQDEIPEADVVSDDGGSGDGGDVCEVISPFTFFPLLDVCENIEIKTVLLFLTVCEIKTIELLLFCRFTAAVAQVLMFDRGDGTYSLKFVQNKCE